MNAGASSREYGSRLLRALRLDPTVYADIAQDRGALPQAAGVVAAGGVAEGLALLPDVGLPGLVTGVLSGFAVWLVATTVIWLLGVRWMGHASDLPALLRGLGFACAPRLLFVVGVVPLGWLGLLLRLVIWVLAVISFVLCVRQELEVDTGRAAWICGLAALATVAFAAVLGLPAGVQSAT